MRLFIISDNHWSQYSSIIRSRGSKFSTRLENQINSIEWALNLASLKYCDRIIHLGDFFDKAELNAEEISALSEIQWPISAPVITFVAGNHEMASVHHDYSSVKVFDLSNHGRVYDKPTIKGIIGTNVELCYLPYILENERKPLSEYFPLNPGKKRIILSHNDISGIQMGSFVSTAGFSIEEIEENCDLFINGHLHNGQKITDKIYNIGNLTGQNFSEDALKYEHVAFILDTNTLQIEVYENPYAFNFYKIDVTEKPFDFTVLKSNAVVTVKCLEKDYADIKNTINNLSNIVESRIIVQYDTLNNDFSNTEDLSINHIDEFEKYILSQLGSSDVVKEELLAIRGY